MTYLLDSNILIYAKMDGMPEHNAAALWLSSALNGGVDSVIVTEVTLLSFLRITTNPKIFTPPLSSGGALTFTKDLLADSSVSLFRPSEEHFVDVARFMRDHKFTGNLTMDAHLAVVALNTGATLVTRDDDFSKIAYLKTLNPFGPKSDE
jgi:uncharacterized protein